ncbi:hypothetical protein BCR44DRAFT_1536119 [Catenaria anguillulae PL171]|uniref:Radical SAM core domain-containing protein n=1 Tax=Catenaria anguillulae PL171 TaxID=765915 RepID=A0A1Y2HZ11_9FUNG|nr:hypothetical protein BCR44DRAFT_1536119 [Catenaria anguillulae PL171]
MMTTCTASSLPEPDMATASPRPRQRQCQCHRPPMTPSALTAFLVSHNLKPHPHANAIQRHLVLFATANPHIPHPDTAIDWTQVPDLPKRAAALLTVHARLATEVANTSTSADGNTTKLLVRILQSGSLVETVVMHYDRKDTHQVLASEPGAVATALGAADAADDLLHLNAAQQRGKRNLKPRTAVCISSQVGCKMACTFCATGTMGFKAHLSPAEIAEQVLWANRIRPISSVIAMGMGEPFDNYGNLVAAINVMTNRRVFALGEGNICVSTVGVVPKIKQFMVDCPGVKLALSLHAPNQELRNTIVPSARTFKLDTLMDAVDQYLTRNKRIMIEYILIRNVNCSIPLAHQLGTLLQSRSVILNLIPYNPTDVGEQYEAPTPQDVDDFERILVQEYKVRTTVRRTMGQDIDGACGQLVVKATRSASAVGAGKCSNDVEDLVDAKPKIGGGCKGGGKCCSTKTEDEKEKEPCVNGDQCCSVKTGSSEAKQRARVVKRGTPKTAASVAVDASAEPLVETDESQAAVDPKTTSKSPADKNEQDDKWLVPMALAALAGVLVGRVLWKGLVRSRLA